jgi:hypothetical protein
MNLLYYKNFLNQTRGMVINMSDLIHTKDKGTIITNKIDAKFIIYGKCGFKVLKSKRFDLWDNGILEIQVK